MDVYTRMYMCIDACIRICICVYAHCVYIYIRHIYTYIYIYKYIYTQEKHMYYMIRWFHGFPSIVRGWFIRVSFVSLLSWILIDGSSSFIDVPLLFTAVHRFIDAQCFTRIFIGAKSSLPLAGIVFHWCSQVFDELMACAKMTPSRICATFGCWCIVYA